MTLYNSDIEKEVGRTLNVSLNIFKIYSTSSFYSASVRITDNAGFALVNDW